MLHARLGGAAAARSTEGWGLISVDRVRPTDLVRRLMPFASQPQPVKSCDVVDWSLERFVVSPQLGGEKSN
jgi:hypothetical protein